jgi:nucleotide-binding universal stress UspA family protein
MSTPLAPRTVILVALDFTEASEAAFSQGVDLAKALAGGELHLLRVVPLDTGNPDAPIGAPERALDDARKALENEVRLAGVRGVSSVEAHLAVGDPRREIVELAVELEADFVVVGSHGKGPVARAILGSVSAYVARKAPCVVVVARPKRTEDRPTVEPPCPACVETRATTAGQTFWCARHAQHHPHGRVRYETPESFAMGSMLIRP